MKGLISVLIYLHFCRTENVSSISELPSTTSQSKTTTLPTTTLPITTYNRQNGDITSTSQHGLSSIRYNRKYQKSNNKGRDSLQIILGVVLGILIVFTIVFVIVLFFLRRWIQRKRLENNNGTGFNNPAFDESNSRQHVNSEFVLSSVSEGQEKHSDHVDDEDDDDDDDDDDNDEVRDIKLEDAKSKLTYQCNEVGVGNDCNATGHEAQSCPTEIKEGARENHSHKQGLGQLVFFPGTTTNRGEINTIEHQKKRRKRHRKSESPETPGEILRLRNNDHQANNPNDLELSEAYQPHQDIKTTNGHDVSEMTDDSAKENNVPVIKDSNSRGLRKSVNLLGDDISVNELLEEASYEIKTCLCADGDTMSNHSIILSAPIDDTRRHPIELPVENITDIA